MPFDLGYRAGSFSSSRPGYDGTCLQDVFRRFPDEDACFEHVLAVRYGSGSICPKCGRRGKWYRRRGASYVQHPCGAVISPLAGSVFHATKLPLTLWFYAMLHFANSQEGVTTGFLQRHLGISYVAAFRMAARVRLHMASLERAAITGLDGAEVQVKLETLHRIRTGRGRQQTAHVMLVATCDRVDMAVVEDPRRHSLRRLIDDLAPGHGPVMTTCYRTWSLLSQYGCRRPLATFRPSFFTDHPDRANLISGYLSYFQWPFQTIHKHASSTHLWLYLKDFQFRYNRRGRSGETYWDMVGAFPSLEETVTPIYGEGAAPVG